MPDLKTRFIRLDDDVCDWLNQMAGEEHQRVSDIANRLLREQLARGREQGKLEPSGS